MPAEPAPSLPRRLLCGDTVAVEPDGRVFLIGSRCADCGACAFPPVPVCSSCMSENLNAERMPRGGTLYAFSTVHVAAPKWKKPMRIGYVDLDNGVRVFTHLDGDVLAIGDRVEARMGVVGEDADGVIESFVFRKAKG